MPSARPRIAGFLHLLRYTNAKWHSREIPTQSLKRRAVGHLGPENSSSITNNYASKYELAVVPQEGEHLNLSLLKISVPKTSRPKVQGQLWKQEKTAKTC